jgi:hypothetical protein
MFNTILTNDPSNWPWTAYINLPHLPIRLISSRFRAFTLILLLTWSHASTGPVGQQGRLLFEYWSKPENAARLSQMKFTLAHNWPPPPLMLIIGFTVIRFFYHKFYAHLYLKCIGTPLPPPSRVRGIDFNEGLLAIRRREQNPNVEVQRQRQVIEADAASFGQRIGGTLIIPFVSSFMGDLLFRLSKHSAILRSFLGIRQKKVSWTDYMLPPWHLYSRLGVLLVDIGWKDLDPYQKAKMGYHLFINAYTIGSWTSVDSDPVWCVFFWVVYFYEIIYVHRWRNAVGIGIFIVVCFSAVNIDPFLNFIHSR